MQTQRRTRSACSRARDHSQFPPAPVRLDEPCNRDGAGTNGTKGPSLSEIMDGKNSCRLPCQTRLFDPSDQKPASAATAGQNFHLTSNQ
jgi:hypothetical protein